MQTPKSTAPKRLRRVYKGTDAQMLATSLVQVDNLIPIQPDLANRREKVTPQYLTDLRKEIADAIEQKLGLNPRSIIQELTGQLKTAQGSALSLFRSFNLDLRDAFLGFSDKSRLQQLLSQLGLRDHYAAAQTRNQQ